MYFAIHAFFTNFIALYMKNFCKKLLSSCTLLFFAVLLLSCSEENEPEIVLSPDNGLAFGLYPNDLAKNDSVSANLAHGVKLVVHPQASYELSFESDGKTAAPNLQLFRLKISEDGLRFRVIKVRELTAKTDGARFVYNFVCEENQKMIWAATLEQNGTFYNGTVKNVRLKGTGAYSDHMSLNLILVGDAEDYFQGYTAEELASQMLSSYRKYYSSVIIDTLYLNHSENHPTLGSKYPRGKSWVAGLSSPDYLMHELGGWPKIVDALDLVLVSYIDEESVMGYSDLFSGNMGAGAGSTVVLGTMVRNGGKLIPLSLESIVQTALHETGHFLGLRHTTTTWADFSMIGDLSNYEDGLEDTPFCSKLQKSGLVKSKALNGTDFNLPWRLNRMNASAAVGVAFSPAQCPDASNFMFPMESEIPYEKFSEQQLATLRSNLMIFPH